jgi:hypothetical protein
MDIDFGIQNTSHQKFFLYLPPDLILDLSIMKKDKELALASLEKLAPDAFAGLEGEAAERLVAEQSTRILTDAAMNISSDTALFVVGGALTKLVGEAFEITAVIQMIGMGLDMWDPCGLGNTLDQDDINSISQTMDNAFYTQILQQQGSYPAIFSAEMVPSYNFQCPQKSDNNTQLKQAVKLVTTDDPCSIYSSFIKEGINEYLNSLKVNALGQCICLASDQELATFITNTTGVTVTADQVRQAKGELVDVSNFKKNVYRNCLH